MVERVSDQASGPPGSGSAAAIVVERLSKRFEATVALEDVSLAIATGEVRAIVGENGAGKSTLVKILSGLVRPDSGEVRVGDAQLGFGSPKRSHAAGIQTAFQEMTLLEGLTVTQNMLLPYEPTWLGLQVDRRASRARVAQQLAALEISGVDPDALVAELDLPTRQKLEIAKAVTRRPSVLLLDEPTSTLPIADVEWLRRQIARLKSAGVTVVFISHRMAEVRQLCESVTVMRNGRHVGSYRLDEVSDDEVVRLMIGRSIGAIYPQRGKPHGRCRRASARGEWPLRRRAGDRPLLCHVAGRNRRSSGAARHGPARIVRCIIRRCRMPIGAVCAGTIDPSP